MRLSDLLGADVVDVDGTAIGRVRDARFVQDGPLQGTFGAALRLEGLIVGPVAIGSRLGYNRRNVTSPWLIHWLVTRLDVRTRYVPWGAVLRAHGRTIELDRPATALERPVPLPVRRGDS